MPMNSSQSMWMAVEVRAGVARITGAAMSIEPQGGSVVPTGQVLFRLKL